MKLSRYISLVLTAGVIITLSVFLTSCGTNPIAPMPNVYVTSISGAIVGPATPASGTTPATAGVGTATFTINVEGAGITIDTDTYTLTNNATGVVSAPITTAYGLTIQTVGGLGTYTQTYTHSNFGAYAAGSSYTATHNYAYRTITNGATGNFVATYQVIFQ